MNLIDPKMAFDSMRNHKVVSPLRAQELAEETSSLILCQSMEAVETSETFRELLARMVEEIDQRTQAQEAATQKLKADPRYASAPTVQGVIIHQQWDQHDQLIELGREEFTVPLPYLVENREKLIGLTLDGADTVAEELGLLNYHHGPFDVTDLLDSIQVWLDATK